MVEWVQPEHREIHDFLTAWGSWCRVPRGQAHCASIEHRYKSPQCWYALEPRPIPADEAQALLIERQMRIVQRVPRKLLKLRYVYRAEPLWIARRLRFPHREFEQRLYIARQIMLNLTRHQLAPTVHGRFHNLCLPDSLSRMPA